MKQCSLSTVACTVLMLIRHIALNFFICPLKIAGLVCRYTDTQYDAKKTLSLKMGNTMHKSKN